MNILDMTRVMLKLNSTTIMIWHIVIDRRGIWWQYNCQIDNCKTHFLVKQAKLAIGHLKGKKHKVSKPKGKLFRSLEMLSRFVYSLLYYLLVLYSLPPSYFFYNPFPILRVAQYMMKSTITDPRQTRQTLDMINTRHKIRHN